MLRDALGLCLTILRLGWWCITTLWLGVRISWRLGETMWRLFHSHETLACPRGHAVPVFGTWTCGCGASYDGRAFARCPICGRTCGWIPCPECHLPVRNPGLE